MTLKEDAAGRNPARGASGVETVPVVIAGAGPVGLALALGLARYGVRTVILEKKPELSHHSKALGVLPRTLEIFRSWGVLERFLEAGIFLENISIHSARDNSVLARIDWSPLRELTPAAGVLILPQNETEALLARSVQETGLSDLRMGHELESFREEGELIAVQVCAPDGGHYEIRGRYLAGCDGSHSRVRGLLGWSLEGKTYPTRIMLADVFLPDERGDLPSPRLWPLGRGGLVAVRFASRIWRIINTITAEESDEQVVSRDGVAARVEKLFGPGEFELVWSQAFRIHRRRSPRFRHGPVVLAGDAAHINSPAGGQGMNSGIQDAHNLAWKLVHALRGGREEDLLASYEQERMEAVSSSVESYTDLLTRLFLLSSPALCRLLKLVVPRLLRRPGFIMSVGPRFGMLDTTYRHSALLPVSGHLIGCRAPDGEVEASDGSRCLLQDLAGPGALLVVFDDSSPQSTLARQNADRLAGVPNLEVRMIVPKKRKPSGNELRDVTGTLWKRWKPQQGTCALIRPDGYVGWMGVSSSEKNLRQAVSQALGVEMEAGGA